MICLLDNIFCKIKETMSKRIPEEEIFWKRAKECAGMLIDYSKLNNFTMQELLGGAQIIIFSIIHAADMKKEDAERIIEEIKELLRESIENRKSCQKNKN